MVIPDKWILMRYDIEAEPVSYAVFGVWYGGYAGSDSWKRSSPIQKVVRHEDRYEITTLSGNTYILGFNNIGTSNYGLSVLSQVRGKDGIDILEDEKEIELILGSFVNV